MWPFGANQVPDVRSLRIPLKYLANLLTAGKEEPVALGLERMLAMRAYMRAKTVDGVIDEAIAKRVGLTALAIEDMYHIMAIANYEDRFVIPTAHREVNEDAYDLRGSCGFSFGNGCSGGASETNLFGTPKRAKTPNCKKVRPRLDSRSRRAALSPVTCGASFQNWPPSSRQTTSTTCRNATFCCLTAPARCRCICSSMCTARAATVAKP